MSACSREPALSAGSSQGLAYSKVTDACLSLLQTSLVIVLPLSTPAVWALPGWHMQDLELGWSASAKPHAVAARAMVRPLEWALPDHKAFQIGALQPLEEWTS
jgi:hypothetical protein